VCDGKKITQTIYQRMQRI